MPIYEYTCSNCHKLSDVLQKLSEPAPEKCPACGAEGTLTRVVSRTSFVLKGGGWGADLYGSKKSAESTAATSSETAKPGDKAPSTPAATSAPAASPGTTSSSAPSSAPSSTPAASSTSDKSGS